MGKPRRNSELAVKKTIYISGEVWGKIVAEAEALGISAGGLVEDMFLELYEGTAKKAEWDKLMQPYTLPNSGKITITPPPNGGHLQLYSASGVGASSPNMWMNSPVNTSSRVLTKEVIDNYQQTLWEAGGVSPVSTGPAPAGAPQRYVSTGSYLTKKGKEHLQNNFQKALEEETRKTMSAVRSQHEEDLRRNSALNSANTWKTKGRGFRMKRNLPSSVSLEMDHGIVQVHSPYKHFLFSNGFVVKLDTTTNMAWLVHQPQGFPALQVSESFNMARFDRDRIILGADLNPETYVYEVMVIRSEREGTVERQFD